MPTSASSSRIAKISVVGFCLVIVPLLLLLLALRPAAGPAQATTVPVETPKHYTDLTFPPLPEIRLPDYTRFRLANGLTVYLMEDHDLPLVSGQLLIRTGDRFEPADKIGLASLTGTVMRTGGTQKTSAADLNNFLEQRAASVEAGIGETSGSAGFNTLTEDLDAVFTRFAEVVQSPAFVPDQVTLAKTQLRGGIARRNDDPSAIAGREFQKLIYGATSPYARTLEYATLDKVSRSDLVQFHQQYFQPQNMLLGIVGDFDPVAMRQRVETQFGVWQPTGSPTVIPVLPPVRQAQAQGVFFVNQPQLTQSTIQIGHLGGQLNSPDYAALSVMNEVLNGFGGRLFNEVRSRQGLAYSVYGVWSPQFDYPGLFVAGGQTRSSATVPFIRSLVAEINRIRTNPVTEAELTTAKDSVLNSFIFNFQEPAQTLSRLMRYEYFGYPPDFIFRYRRGVEATTLADVQRVAKTYLKPENLVTLVVGQGQDMQPPLSSLEPGEKVTAIDVTIPPANPQPQPR
jgi:zinc protease